MAGNLQIQVIGKERIKLDAKQSALGQQSSMLFDGGEEVLRGRIMGEHNCLAAQCADLGSADIEAVAVIGNIRKGHISLIAHQAIAHPGPVQIQRQLIFAAYLGQGSELSLRIQRTALCRMRDIDHAGKYHVLMICIAPESFQQRNKLFRNDLSIMFGERHDLMASELNRTGFVDVDMAALCTDNALIRGQIRVDHSGIGLSTAGEEKHVSVGAGAGLTNLRLGALTEAVVAVAHFHIHIRLHKTTENFRVCTAVIVIFKRQHIYISPFESNQAS